MYYVFPTDSIMLMNVASSSGANTVVIDKTVNITTFSTCWWLTLCVYVEGAQLQCKKANSFPKTSPCGIQLAMSISLS